jgi:hypothetical protein
MLFCLFFLALLRAFYRIVNAFAANLFPCGFLTNPPFIKRVLIFFPGCGRNISYPGKPAMLKISKPESESRKGVRAGPSGGSIKRRN